MRPDTRDGELKLLLRDLPREHGNRYSDTAAQELLKILFYNLSDSNPDLLSYFFPQGSPKDPDKPWNLSQAQGAIQGAEYSEGARGRPCGHVFQPGEATYSCKTCTTDDTCVLCVRCFEASDHEGHQVTISPSHGISGCCDCGDPEAFVRPLNCSIHSLRQPRPGQPLADEPLPGKELPERLRRSITITIGRALDYVCDVFSCSPEQMRTPQSEEAIRDNEAKSRLSAWYGKSVEPEQDNEFALVLWNDEKHTFQEVQDEVAKACKMSRTRGLEIATQVDAVGRCVVLYSRNVSDLIGKARILGRINLTVTIRSARDTFREQMCQTIIEWLSDIARCRVGKDPHFLMHVICEELVNRWRIGSTAFNLSIAEGGIIDFAAYEGETFRSAVVNRLTAFQQAFTRRAAQANDISNEDNASDLDSSDLDGDEADENDISQELDDENDDENDDEVDDEDDVLEGDSDDMEIDNAFIEEFVVVPGEVQENLDHPDSVTTAIFGQTPVNRLGGDHNSAGPAQSDPNKLFTQIPKTSARNQGDRPLAPSHWLVNSFPQHDPSSASTTPLWADMHQRVRIDHLVFYDMRMWKTLRDSLRQFYIATVVTVPSFKRILSLRFAALYTHLSQLYLLADRESEHSIIQLSLQMLTTPSITEEVVKRSNFFKRLLAILYTFLTKRQVGEPEDVDPQGVIPFEQSVMANRRIQHVFNDMNYLLEARFVQVCIKTEPEFLLQWLDFAKLFQGVCPNKRALGQHVEYESDAWFAASFLMRDVIHMTRKICESFRWHKLEDPSHICRAIRQTARVAIISSLGIETARFKEGELTAPVTLKTLPQFSFETAVSGDDTKTHQVIHCIVDQSPMSFHHVVHYTLSWLIDSGRSMTQDQLGALLVYSHQQLQSHETRSGSGLQVPLFELHQYLLALFDIPLRVCVWIAQMRARMWIRNGQTLRHQLSAYCGVTQRSLTHQRDLFLLQTAFVVCPAPTFLASIIERFGLSSWIAGDFRPIEGHDEEQAMDITEDFVSLLGTLLCDRSSLLSVEDEPKSRDSNIKTDLIHTLCFKPLTFSKLAERISDRVVYSQDFQQILQEIANFRPPEGLADSGTWRLKEEYFQHLNPYYPYYNKSQREEAETLYRNYKSKVTGLPVDQIFYEPSLRAIPSGIFQTFANFSQLPLFSQIVYSSLTYINIASQITTSISSERVESFLHVVLHLAMIAILEDRAPTASDSRGQSFLDSCFDIEAILKNQTGPSSIIKELFVMLQSEKFVASRPRIRFVLRHIQQGRPLKFEESISSEQFQTARTLLNELQESTSTEDQSLKKKQALARQAKVMAAFKKQQNEFLESQNFDWGLESGTDSDDDMDYAAQTSENKVWEVPTGTCILCQDETSDKQIYGTLAYFTESHLFRQTNLQDPDYVREVFAIPNNFDKSAEDIRPFGVAGENTERIFKNSSDGTQIEIERKGLGKGFPRSHVKSGPSMSGCGHIMHLSCFNDFWTSTDRRHQYQFTRCHPEVLSLEEFVCPLCKALGNAFLPVVWNPRHRIEPFSSDDTELESWLDWISEHRDSKSAYAYTMYPEHFRRYASENLVSTSLSERTIFVNQEHPEGLASHRPPIGSQRQYGHVTTTPLAELQSCYYRLQRTMKSNKLPSRFNHDTKAAGHLSMVDTLADSVGCSISAVEIAQRGVESETSLFVDSISNQTIAQLRSLAETVSAYISLGVMQTTDGTLREVNDCLISQLGTLLLNRDSLDRASEIHGNPPLLSRDPFVLAAACSMLGAALKEIDIHHILRLCYLAEVVKVVIAVLRDSEVVDDFSTTGSVEPIELDSIQWQNFSSFIQSLIHQYKSVGDGKLFSLDVDENPNNRFKLDRLIRTMISSYVLPYVRKCALLMAIRFGVDYSTFKPRDPSAPELERLLEALDLPKIDDLVASYIADNNLGTLFRSFVSLWFADWQHCCIEMNRGANNQITTRQRESILIRLAHPGIYELVALPYAHDTLYSIATNRRCPTTKRELGDPNLCLFCGEIFCGQSQCCSTNKNGFDEGGCHSHQSTCGGNIGMFLNIKRCAILFLNRKRGSWFDPPYLDRHGEVDVGLKRRQQLFLHPKRYDRLFRDVWLGFGGGVPSAVARKLEADVSPGGWETL